MKLKLAFLSILIVSSLLSKSQNKDPQQAQIVTSDITNFWKAFDASKPEFGVDSFQKLYLDNGSDGLKGFIKGRIVSADHMASVVKSHARYYESIRPSTDSVMYMEDQIRESFINLKKIYPKAIFPTVYFVVGCLNSGGTTSSDGLIIGVDMYGQTPETPTEELNDWLKTVIKPVSQLPHIVAHELIHFQQHNAQDNSLLAASINEGSADFIAELISGKHINQHVHDFANPREKELWKEFKDKMLASDYAGWLYSSTEGRPNDLGYWMGYKITRAYYDSMDDKNQAINDILNIKDFEAFLQRSGYSEKFHN